MIKKIFFTLLLLIPTLFANADTVKFTMSGPNVVSMGEQFRLSFTLNEQGSDLQLPDVSSFDVLMGPSTSQSSSIQIINGQTTQSVSFSYTYVLRAKEEGTFTIRPASIKVDGKIYESNELSIQVVRQSTQQGASASQSQSGQSNSTASTEISKDELFVKVELDKRNVYRGEQIIATVKIYVSPNVPITSFGEVQLPSYEGFWTQEVDIPDQVSFTREAYNNTIYQVGILKKTILFPQQTGNITIDPFEITCLIRQQISNQRSFFDSFFDNYRNVSAKIISEPVNITVKELPNQPSTFYGGVGNLNFSASMDKTEAKTNDAITLTVNVSGSGNLNLIEAPKIEFPVDFEVYDPKTINKISTSANGVSGSVAFEYLIIPRIAGDYSIQPIKFSSFNPSTGRYKTQSSQDFTLHIEKGNDEQNATVTSAYSKEDVRFIGKDIRFIKQNQYKLKAKAESFYGNPLFWLMYLIPLLAFVVLFIVYRKKLRENANLLLVKNKKANKVARMRLKEAENFMKNNKAEEFYEAVLKAFWGYLSDKLSIPVSDLNRDKASATLATRQVEQQVIEEFISTIDTCEFARYAPTKAEDTLSDLYQKSADLMGKLEKQIR